MFGVTLTDRTEGEITRARVAIDSTIGQGSRNLTILHELLHVVGLGHVECPTSAVTGDIGGSPIWTLSGLDEQLLTTWYSPGMPTGSPLADIEAALVVVPGGPECEVQVVEGVETPVGTIWCSLGGEGARSCVEVDGTDPPPEVPIVLPDRWIRSGVVYDHDPDLYEVVVFDGRRLLCALGSEPRRPCQFTDGPGPITSPDVWTDGSVIYDTP